MLRRLFFLFKTFLLGESSLDSRLRLKEVEVTHQGTQTWNGPKVVYAVVQDGFIQRFELDLDAL